MATQVKFHGWAIGSYADCKQTALLCCSLLRSPVDLILSTADFITINYGTLMAGILSNKSISSLVIYLH